MIGLAVAAWLFVQDPVGDTGTLQPPTAGVYRSLSAFDVTTLEISDAPELTFKVTLASLANPFELPNGFSFPILELYLSNETEGSADLLPGSQMSLPEGTTWRYALRLTGDRVQVFAAENGNVLEVTATQNVDLSRDGTTLTLATTLPRPETGSVYGLVGSYSPFSPSGWQPLSAQPSPWAFSSEETTLPVLDVITEDGAAQARALQTGVLPPLSPTVTPSRSWNGWIMLMVAGGVLALVGVIGRFRVGKKAVAPAAPTDTDTGFSTESDISAATSEETFTFEKPEQDPETSETATDTDVASPFSGDTPATIEFIEWLTSDEGSAADLPKHPTPPPDADSDSAAKPPPQSPP